jgi:uncharacterized protein (TIGR02246 family)
LPAEARFQPAKRCCNFGCTFKKQVTMQNKAADIEAINQANQAIYRIFETLDFSAAAAYLTEDCDYITFNGMHLKGREAYIKTHEELMNNFMFRGARLEGQIEQIRFLSESTALIIATGAIRFRWQKKAPQSRQSVNTTVWVKEADGQWRLTSFHNCRIKKMGRMATWLTRQGRK